MTPIIKMKYYQLKANKSYIHKVNSLSKENIL